MDENIRYIYRFTYAQKNSDVSNKTICFSFPSGISFDLEAFFKLEETECYVHELLRKNEYDSSYPFISVLCIQNNARKRERIFNLTLKFVD